MIPIIPTTHSDNSFTPIGIIPMSRCNGLNDSLGLSRQIIRPCLCFRKVFTTSCLCFRKILYFCTEKSHLTDKLCTKEQNGVHVEKEVYRHSAISIDMVVPHVMVLLCLSGTAHNDLQLRQQMLLSHLATGIYPQEYKRGEFRSGSTHPKTAS